jgi:PAS domain S-box-containing protein
MVQYQHKQHLLSALVESRATLQEFRAGTEAMLNSLGEGLIVTDGHGEITTVNSYALSALGFEEHELLGKWLPKTVISVDQYARVLDQMDRPIIRALSTGQTVSGYSHYLTKNNYVMPVHITVSPIIVDDVPTGAVEVFRDLTKEQQLDFAKDEFVSLASHQLRTPATGVKSILAMLAAGDFGDLTPTQQIYINKAISRNDQQLQIIEDLLTVALVDAGKMELDPEYIDLAALVREAAQEQQPTFAAKNQRLIVQSPLRARLIADSGKLRMVIDNLLTNASKYSGRDAAIEATLTMDADRAQLAVHDEGVGISSRDLPNLFGKFTRLPNELSQSAGGSGLGLFLSKSIIDLHHGSLTVNSKQGVGSTFTISLPAKWRT